VAPSGLAAQLLLQAGAGTPGDELPRVHAGLREASSERRAWGFSSACEIVTLLLQGQVLHNSVLDLATCSRGSHLLPSERYPWCAAAFVCKRINQLCPLNIPAQQPQE